VWRIIRAAICFLVAWGLLYAIDLVRQPDIGSSISLPHRLQTDALMAGQLSLSTNLAFIEFDLTYSNGGVQQVWGLGVPLWRMFFEIPAQLFLHQTAPDRLALWIALAFLFYLTYGTLKSEFYPSTGGCKIPWNQKIPDYCMLLVAVGMLVCGPFLLNILRTRMLVYEETLVYLYLFAICQFVLFLRLRQTENPTRAGVLFVILCFLAGFGALIRPTLLFYGVATIVVGFFYGVRRTNPSRRWMALWCGAFALPLIVLAWTNRIRFGAPWEFGHALNIQNLQESLYMTHFEATITQAPWWDRLCEVWGALFFVDEFNSCSYLMQHFFPGQSEVLRWREFNYTTFDPLSGALVGIFLVSVLGSLLLHRRNPKSLIVRCFEPALYPAAAWVGISAFGLVLFYCYSPVLTARYMYDFAPAFTVAITFALWGMSRRTPLFIFLSLFLCGYSIGRFESNIPVPGIASTKQAEEYVRDWKKRDHPVELPETYSIGMEKIPDIPEACMGWDHQTGECKLVSIFYLMWPQELTLCFEGEKDVLEAYPPESIRVTTGCGVMWKLSGVSKSESAMSLTFEAPARLYRQGRNNPAVIFIAVGSPEQWVNKEARPKLVLVKGD